MIEPLPIDPYIPDIVAALGGRRAVVVVAEPGAGKTTRVPPALVPHGDVLLLQPRRAAARAIASRIAAECHWTIGREVGWQIRFEQRFTSQTRLLVATEGILTARLQQDPLLSGFQTVVLDEFHERSIHADLGIALARQAWLARNDLRIVVMSATLDAERVAEFLGDCPIIDVPGRLHPLEIAYAPAQSAPEAALQLLQQSRGDVLCFLPGAYEIQKCLRELRARVPAGVELLPLHGTLDAAQQDRALTPSHSSRRRIIAATNIAETSVTVPGVSAIVDTGLQKVARYDAARAIDSLATERITQDSADQRAGRAGRTGPGVVRRLWDARDRLRPHREPDILRIDLSSTVLDILTWGGDPRSFEWFESPRPAAIDGAMALLERLGALADGTLTSVGRTMQSIALHPRLARILIAGQGAREVVRACALLSERLFIPPRTASTSSDLLSALDAWPNLPAHIHHAAREIEAIAGRVFSSGKTDHLSDENFRRALLAGYPDRVAWRREPAGPRLRMASGTGAVVAPESGVSAGEFLVAVDVQAPVRQKDAESRVRVASLIDRQWLSPTSSEVIHRLDHDGTVRACRIERYDALILSERTAEVDDEIAAGLLIEAWRARTRSEEDARLVNRLKFSGRSFDLAQLIRAAAAGVRSLNDLRLANAIRGDVARTLDRDAPETLRLPSGRTVRLEYRDDGTVAASAKLQELFGLGETPHVGPKHVPVLLSLLAPNGRPVQVTRDLRSFWDRTYSEVRKELRGRYPKHPWPDDPWNAQPTARTVRRK